MSSYLFYNDKLGVFTLDRSEYSGDDYYGFSSYYMSSTEEKNWKTDGILSPTMQKYWNIKGDPIMAKAKNKKTSEKHYIVRDTHYGLIGDNFTDLDEAKEAAAKQFKTKRISSTTTSRDIVVYESIACIKEPVPAVDWVTIN